MQLKSRRLAYYDFDKEETRTRVFSALEIEHANHIFDTIENILLEYDLDVENKWISAGECQCKTHNDTYFMMEVESDMISIDVIHDIEEALEEYHVKLVEILAKHQRRRNYLELIIIQEHIHGEIENK
jgi:hypothetical protein